MFKKFLLLIAIFYFLFSIFYLFSSPALALEQPRPYPAGYTPETWYYSPIDEFLQTVQEEELNMEKTSLYFVSATAASLGTSITGGSTGQVRTQGLVPMLGGVMASMVANPPARTQEYLADISNSIGIPFVKPVYAQGTGFEALAPILPVWKAFRNVSYAFFVIIFVVIGFLIMFRAKINPQTVIGVQAALPNLVITLLLITFSYAIAALMIDLIYVSIYLFAGVFQAFGVFSSSSSVINHLFDKNLFQIIWSGYGAGIGGEAIGAAAGAVKEIIKSILGGFDWLGLAVGVIPEGVSRLTTGEGLVSNLAYILAYLIFAIAIIFSMFRLFISLLFSYIGIVLSIIFAPFQLLFNALPGSNSFASWLRNLFANIAVFPAVALMFMLAAILTRAEDEPWFVSPNVGFTGEDTWTPPFLNVFGEGAGVSPIKALIAFGMILMTPQVAAMIKKALKVEEPFPGAAIIGAAAAPIRMYQTFQAYQTQRAEAMMRATHVPKGGPVGARGGLLGLGWGPF